MVEALGLYTDLHGLCGEGPVGFDNPKAPCTFVVDT